jgi:hypothetical protein
MLVLSCQSVASSATFMPFRNLAELSFKATLLAISILKRKPHQRKLEGR